MGASRNIRLVAPYSITHRIRVKADEPTYSVIHYLTHRFPHISKKEWHHRINNGLIQVERMGKIVDEAELFDQELMVSDVLLHHVPTMIEPSVPNEVHIIDEQPGFIVVFKPAPLPMHSGGRYHKNTLVSILAEMGYHDLKIVHRLDAVTSGLVVLAKNKEYARLFTEAFQSQNVQKTYWALVNKLPLTDDAQRIQVPVKRKKGFVFECAPDLKGALDAVTMVSYLPQVGQLPKDSYLVECRPLTGRTHQIRLHLDWWGHPICNDPIYGPHGDRSGNRIQNVGIALISKELKFPSLNYSYVLPDAMAIDTLLQ